MLLVIYVTMMTLATLFMAVGCWLPASMLLVCGLTLAGWCLFRRSFPRRWDGVERRSSHRDQRGLHFGG